jgi:hypothetical protein
MRLQIGCGRLWLGQGRRIHSSRTGRAVVGIGFEKHPSHIFSPKLIGAECNKKVCPRESDELIGVQMFFEKKRTHAREAVPRTPARGRGRLGWRSSPLRRFSCRAKLRLAVAAAAGCCRLLEDGLSSGKAFRWYNLLQSGPAGPGTRGRPSQGGGGGRARTDLAKLSGGYW